MSAGRAANNFAEKLVADSKTSHRQPSLAFRVALVQVAEAAGVAKLGEARQLRLKLGDLSNLQHLARAATCRG